MENTVFDVKGEARSRSVEGIHSLSKRRRDAIVNGRIGTEKNPLGLRDTICSPEKFLSFDQ